MSGLKLVLGTALGLSLIACSATDPVEPAEQPSAEDSGSSWREQQYQRGREVYQSNCSHCHDKGKSAAPYMGDRESWSNRSPLWCAVLYEHAKNGYLAMPARGGDADLSDSDVEAAGEFMLGETFPELPRD